MRSQRGASILLALLFFLVCAMVGASVLMAAASNAGKMPGLRSRAPVLLRPGVRMIGLRLLRLRLRNGHVFLVCAMVGASVLMAAASNAGKSRSSREEQQKYLTLSSAMHLRPTMSSAPSS